MDIVVVGAGITGLGTALMLGQAGHRVTLLERDAAPPDDPEEAWHGWERRGVPQLRLAHVFLGRLRNMLRDEQPELYAELMDAGANEMSWYDSLPPTITDRSPRPIDGDLAMLGMRRPVFELHLRRALARTPGVEVRSGVAVSGITSGPPVVAGIPHVTGVLVDGGSTIAADLVVDCGGRRSSLPTWLDALGAPPMPVEEVADGLMYFGRYYRLDDGQDYADLAGGVVVDLGYLFGLTFRADDGWFAIALAVHNEDKAIRALRDERVFEAALQAIPRTARWRTPGSSTPMTEVKTMSRIDDQWRDFVVDGAPLATGILPVGDSMVATNPALGRGSSLGWIAGRALADVLGQHEQPVDIATAYHDAMLRLVRPWFDQTAQIDASRLEGMRRILAGEPEPEVDESDPEAAFGTGFQLGSQVDAEVYRGMGQVAHLLADPMTLLGDADLAARVIDVYTRRNEISLPPSGPSRQELIAVLEEAGG